MIFSKFFNYLYRIISKYSAFTIRKDKIWSNVKGDIYTEIDDLINYSNKNLSDISSHLPTILYEVILQNPKLIVELGVRNGESTQAFLAASKLTGSKLLSIDIDDCSKVVSDPDWLFYKGDDISFAKKFISYAKNNNLPHEIDVLFIDTSHTYDHTLEEMKYWFPFLGKKAKVIFHDTHSPKIVKIKDGSLYPKINQHSQREVISAIEAFFNIKIDERMPFIYSNNKWLFKHDPFSFGLTILKRL